MTAEDFDELMKKWEDALEAYGTPGDIADRTTVDRIKNPGNNYETPIRAVVAPGYAQRVELMGKQKRESGERKARQLPPRWKNDGESCFLCDNMGQAEDIGNNLMLPWSAYEDYALVPNRYPIMRGHFLLCMKEHNSPGEDNIITPNYIETAVELAEKYGLGFLRNHPQAGMSIPEHEHLLLHFGTLKTKSGENVHYNGLMESVLVNTEYAEDIYSVNRTRFDTLAFRGKKSLEKFVGSVDNLRGDDIIFTFGYESSGEGNPERGVFFLTPHFREREQGGIGGGTPFYIHIVPSEEEFPEYEGWIRIREQFIHPRGSFDWGKYVSA